MRNSSARRQTAGVLTSNKTVTPALPASGPTKLMALETSLTRSTGSSFSRSIPASILAMSNTSLMRPSR